MNKWSDYRWSEANEVLTNHPDTQESMYCSLQIISIRLADHLLESAREILDNFLSHGHN